MDLSILDKPIRAIREALAGISPDEAKVLLEAEQNGKTRKGAIAAIEESLEGALVAAGEKPSEPVSNEPNDGRVGIRSVLPEGSTLHLGDGRQLASGETARVSPSDAAFLRERGQAE